MSVEERNLQQICFKMLNNIPDNDNNKEKFKIHINSILRTYIYAAPELKIDCWFRIQNVLEDLYPIYHPCFHELNKIWSGNE